MTLKASGQAGPRKRAATRPAGTAGRDAAVPGADSIPGRSPRRYKRPDATRWAHQAHWVRNRSDAPRLAELRRVAALVARPVLRRVDFDPLARIGSDALLRRFGSWRAALAKAGLLHRYAGYAITPAMRAKPARGLDDDQLLDLLRRSATRDGVVTLARLHRKFGVSADALKRRFGSWQEAVRRAGLTQSSYARDPAMLAALCGRKPKATRRGKNPGTRPARPEQRRFVPVGLRFRILKRDAYRCCLCGDSPAISKGTTLEVDHIEPFSQGGKTTEDNLRTLCRRCNQGKGARG